MEELVKHINDTNASYRAMGAADAKNTDLFLDNEHYELFKDSGDQITVRFNKENLSKAILFIASVLPRKYDNSTVHKTISYSSEFVLDQLAFLDGFFTVDGKRVETRIQKWNARKDVMKTNGDIDKRFYFNGLLEDINYITYKGERKSAKFTIRNYFAGGYSDLHIRKANDGIFDIWITNTQTPYDDGKDKHHEIIDDQSLPLQQIFYGAPGTGKSHEIKEKTKGKSVIRTTFHPDSDYSTFVGAYKPTSVEVPVRDVTGKVIVEYGKQVTEKRIVYEFVKQAFLKAYLGAWKKYADRATVTSIPLVHTFKINDGEYTITEVKTNEISFRRVFRFDISHSSVERVWNEIWSTGSFVIPTGAQPGVSVQQAIAKWMYDNVQNCTQQSLGEGMEALKKSIEEKGQVPISRSSQTYILSKKANGYFIDADGNCSRPTIQEYYKGNEPESGAKGLQRYFANLLKEIDSSSFENAWNLLAEAISKNADKIDLRGEKNVLEPQFLVVEEINRGNCAQIFGDLFQLLDRSDNGFSEYPIEADTDLQQEIARAFKEDAEYKLARNIEADDVVIGYESNYGRRLSEDIQEGRILLLPPNLFIWATMNTSDQSLFPIDSAFKRRWDWQYMPIANGNKGWRISANGNEYDWWDFLEKINALIGEKTSSEDKKLGYYFCKAKDGIIDAKMFVGKVIFYLWNDVFKDYEFEGNVFNDVEGKLTFDKFYQTIDGTTSVVEEKVAMFLRNLGVKILEEDIVDDEADDVPIDENGVSRHKSLRSVKFQDGTLFSTEEMSHFDVYLESLKKIGLEKVQPIVANMKYRRMDCPMISLEEMPGIVNSKFKYHKEGNYYIVKGAIDDTLINILNELNSQLNIGYIVSYE